MAIQTLDQVLDDLVSRIYRLESFVTTPGTIGSDHFDEIIIDDGTDDVIIRPAKPEKATDITVTVGSFYDVIYADVFWTPPVTGEPPLYYNIEVAKKLDPTTYDLAMVNVASGNAFRMQPLEPDTDYGVRVTSVSRIGQDDGPSDWVDFTTSHDNTVPDPVSDVMIGRGATSVIVTFTGSDSPDMQNGKGIYLIEIDTAGTFDTANYHSMRSTATVVQFSDVVSESSTWRARVTPIDPSGNAGAAVTSSTASAGGVIDSMLVGSFSAAHITFGDMSGDRITSNTASVGILKTSSLTSADITVNGGSIKVGSPPSTGLLINSQGLHLYAAGVRTVFLDASTGSGAFKGAITASTMDSTTITGGSISGTNITGVTITGATIQTATSGARIVMSTSTVNQINFYSGNAGEVSSGAMLGEFAGGFPRIRMISPTYTGFTDPSQIFLAPTIVDISGTRTGAAGSIIMRADTMAFKVRFGAGSDFLIQDATNSDTTLFSFTRTSEGFGQLATRDVYVSNLTATAVVGDASSGVVTADVVSCNTLSVTTFSPSSISTSGAISTTSSASPALSVNSKFTVRGSDGLTQIAGTAGSDSVITTGNMRANAFTPTSDRKLKKNISDFTPGGLETIKSIRLRKYQWKDGDHDDYGVLAQELPEDLQHLGEDGVMSYDLCRLVMNLVRGMQEQDEEITLLKQLVAN